MKKDIDLCGLGNSLVDIQVHSTDNALNRMQLKKGEMVLIEENEMKRQLKLFKSKPYHKCPGGSAANSIIAFSKFGGKAAYITLLGNDDNGNYYKNDFENLNVKLSAKQLEGVPTGICFVIITNDGERTMSTFLGATGLFSEEFVDEDLIARSKWLYIEGYQFSTEESTKAIFKAIEIAKKHNTKIALTISDAFVINNFRPALAKALKETDLIFCNENEALLYSKKYDTQSAIKFMQQSSKNSVVTLGAKGAVVGWLGQVYQIPPYPANPKDTTGAGDMFAGAFMYGILYSESAEIAGNLASYSASRIVSQIGARLDEDHKEIRNLIFGKY